VNLFFPLARWPPNERQMKAKVYLMNGRQKREFVLSLHTEEARLRRLEPQAPMLLILRDAAKTPLLQR
jgi:hypothetical protein